jgi:hypothetical protein
MKSRFSRMAVLTALVLTSPLLSLAGGQPNVRTVSKSEMQDRTGITRAVQQGKGSGMTRNQRVQANAYRLQTPADSATAKSSAARTNWSDPAFHK